MYTENIILISFSKKSSILFFILASIFSFLFSFQESYSQEMGLNSLEMTMVPEIPKANEKVKVKLNSYSFDVNSSEISVIINDVIIHKEIGLKTFFFTTGDLGKVTNLKILIKKLDGDIIEKNYSIVPSEVDLVYELENSHIPFGYKGKSTLLSNSNLTVYAFPSLVDSKGQNFSKNSLIYTWYKNFDIDLKNSGFGKSTYKIDRLDAFPRETRVTVKVSSLDGSIIAKNHIILQPNNSEVEFYLLEPWLTFSFKNIANPNIFVEDLDAEIMAVPYFMDDIEGEYIIYNWKINNKYFNHSKGLDKNKITLANDVKFFVERVGLSLEIVNRKRILQSLLQKDFSVNFIKQEDSEQQIFSEGRVRFEKDSIFD